MSLARGGRLASMELPVVDLTPLRTGAGDVAATGAAIDDACRRTGFFYVTGHGVPDELGNELERLAREFFALDDAEKAAIAMPLAGRAWRGWFPVGGELTSGTPDAKEGLYFGEELPPDDARVVAGRPLHGPNLFPARPPGLREAVLSYMDAVTRAGHLVLRGIASGLGIEPDWFDAHLTADPLVLFRIFHYPPAPDPSAWGVGTHTDYGLVTLLRQDATGGLEVRVDGTWVDAPPIPGSFVVNLGDMLERMTGGAYRSTPHRVRNTSGRSRLSFPLFLDPAWDAEVRPVPGARSAAPDARDRWDGASVHEWSGTYGEYLLQKVGRVFPALGDAVLPPS